MHGLFFACQTSAQTSQNTSLVCIRTQMHEVFFQAGALDIQWRL
jgi:hypothetical protein